MMTTTEAPNLDQWNEQIAQNSKVSLEELEEVIKLYRTKRDEAEKFRIEKTRIEKEFAEIEGKLVEAMQQMGKSKVYVEGAGTLYFIDKMVVPTPKTNKDKVELFSWIKKEYGDAVLLEKTSINHQTLQSLYNSAVKEHVEKCEKQGTPELAASFSIPGLQAPTSMRSLGFRKD